MLVTFLWYDVPRRATVLGRMGWNPPPSKSGCSILPIARLYGLGLRSHPTIYGSGRAHPHPARPGFYSEGIATKTWNGGVTNAMPARRGVA
jgi:hypothetical protein